jgi:hypothetical protein
MAAKKNKKDSAEKVRLLWDALGADGQKVCPLRRVFLKPHLNLPTGIPRQGGCNQGKRERGWTSPER